VLACAIAAHTFATGQVHAQEQPQHKSGGNEGKIPIGWLTRIDGSEDMHGDFKKGDSLSFVQMTPGFHVTTGPNAILWHPDSSARGNFTIESSIFLFPTKGRDREGYGVFVGGQDLAGAAQRYTYFLLRNDGRFLVKQRVGNKTVMLKDWTYLTAIKLATAKDAMKNDFRVAVGAQRVTFSVNGTEAVSLARSQVSPDGVFGLRFAHAVNAHVTNVARRPSP